MWQFLFYRIAQIIIHCVPRKQAYEFARFVSDLHYKHSVKDREAVVHNLRQILNTDEDVSEMAREVFHNFGRYLADFFFMYRVNEAFVKKNVRVIGRSNLSKAVLAGHGVIILTAHVGNWEMGAAVLAEMGHKLTVIALPHKERSVNDLFNRQRQKHGVTVVPTSVALRRCVEALRKGQLIALLGDRDFGNHGEKLMFLGRETHIPKGAVHFSYKTGAPIVPSFLIPNKKEGTYTLFFGEPILAEKGIGEESEVILDMIRKCSKVIEDVIRRYPTQWLMFRKFGVDYEYMYSHPGP